MTLLAGLLRSRRRAIARAGAGMQDTGGLNAASPLGNELLWAVVSGAHPWRDRKGGTDGQAEGGAGTVTDDSGFSALRSPSWSGAGWYWPAPVVTSKEWTWQVRLRLDPPTGEAGYVEGELPKILAIPYFAGAEWAFPFSFDFFMLSMTEGQTTSQARIGYAANASTRRTCTSPADFILLDGAEHTYAARVRDQGTNGEVDWWRDGAAIGATIFNGAHAVPDLGAKPHLITLTRHRLTPLEGTRAAMPAAGLWGKALSDAQIQLFHSNPWDLVQVSADPLVPPTLHAWDIYVEVQTGEVTRIVPLANDSGAGLTLQGVTQPSGVHAGTAAAIVGGAGGTEIDITVAEEEEAASFEFTYTARDAGLDEDTATVHVEVHGHGDPGTPDPGDPGEPGAFNNRPYQGVLYGSAIALGRGYGDTRLRRAGANAIQMYFVASRTGHVVGWHQHKRIDVSQTEHKVGTETSNRTGAVLTASFQYTRPNANGTHGSDYSRGDGGRYNVYIYPADPNTKRRVPNSQPLGVKTNWIPGLCIRKSDVGTSDEEWGWPNFLYPIVLFDNPVPLVAGESYVLVWDNTHASPSNNYFSINSAPAVVSDIHQDPPPFIGHAGSGWTPAAAGSGINGKDWYPWTTLTENQQPRHRRYGPELVGFRWSDRIITHYSGGGGGQRDSSDGSQINAKEHTSTEHVRERFRPSFDGLVVDGVWFFAWRRGSQSGNVVVTLEQGPASDTSGNGTVLWEGSIPINSLSNVGTSYNIGPSDTPDKVSWVFLPFGQQFSLLKGTIYNIRLRVSGSGRFWMGANEGPEHTARRWSPVASSWDEHEAITERSLENWKDSRGTMITSNSGSSWSYWAGNLRKSAPICFRCVV